MKQKAYALIITVLLLLLAAQASAVERLPVVDVVIVPGQTAVVVCDGMTALIEVVDDLTVQVECIR